MLKPNYPHYIGGRAESPNSDLQVLEKFSGEVAACVPLASAADVERAIAAASAAAPAMAAFKPWQRQAVLEHCVRRFRERADELALALCIEAGKPIKDSRGEVTRLIDTFRIASDSNRVGLRLDGAALALRAPLELVSEAVAFGTVQLPPGGQPIVLMAEHPTTGGYPRVAQVAAVDLPRLAQRRPGSSVRFVEIGLDDAQTRYLRRERELARLIDAIAQRLGP